MEDPNCDCIKISPIEFIPCEDGSSLMLYFCVHERCYMGAFMLATKEQQKRLKSPPQRPS